MRANYNWRNKLKKDIRSYKIDDENSAEIKFPQPLILIIIKMRVSVEILNITK